MKETHSREENDNKLRIESQTKEIEHLNKKIRDLTSNHESISKANSKNRTIISKLKRFLSTSLVTLKQ